MYVVDSRLTSSHSLAWSSASSWVISPSSTLALRFRSNSNWSVIKFAMMSVPCCVTIRRVYKHHIMMMIKRRIWVSYEKKGSIVWDTCGFRRLRRWHRYCASLTIVSTKLFRKAKLWLTLLTSDLGLRWSKNPFRYWHNSESLYDDSSTRWVCVRCATEHASIRLVCLVEATVVKDDLG